VVADGRGAAMPLLAEARAESVGLLRQRLSLWLETLGANSDEVYDVMDTVEVDTGSGGTWITLRRRLDRPPIRRAAGHWGKRTGAWLRDRSGSSARSRRAAYSLRVRVILSSQ
jgi:hypothetical protein